MAAGDRAESVRRIVEVTGLGIAATYFLDPEHGAERRRTARRWIAAAIGDHRVAEPESSPLVAAAPEPAQEEPPEPASSTAVQPPPPHEEVVVVTSVPAPVASARSEDGHWPRWGWALVVTITLCAVAAFAAVGVGIWAVATHRSTTTVTTATVPRQITSAATILADPAARRIVGTATTGRILLRTDDAGGALAVDGLPRPAARELYRVWVTASGRTTAAGAFAGTSALLGLSTPPATGARITITREPAAADATAPRGPRVASVTVS